jgi:5-methylcytosine-specific restriction endonuclease McrA
MIPKDADKCVRERAQHRGGYCRSPQKYVFGKLEIEHIIPKAAGGTDDEDNLWLACRLCNGFKAAQTHADDPPAGKRIRLFDPRKQRWQRHFKWSDDGTRAIGRTVCGRATVAALQLNNVIAVMVRREWVAAGWHPPKQ